MPIHPQWQRLEELYYAALELPDVERTVFLSRACENDEVLLKEITSLLTARAAAQDFLAPAAVEFIEQAPAQLPTPATLPGQMIQHYKILSLLGVGGMGEVFLTEDTRLHRKVALKLLPAKFAQNADRVRRFEQEARVVSALNHPNIVTLFDLGQVEQHYFMTTEFIDGHTLREHLQERCQLPVQEAIEITGQIASALLAAHAAGIIHRDIKPENVMLRRDGYVKVLDFGLAKLTESHAMPSAIKAQTHISSLTDPGTVMGTVSYMSPEQARGQKVDTRSDVFSLGALLYEMVAGKAPFEGVNAFEVIAAILEREPLPLCKQRAEVPAELERIVSRALEKDREMRHQSASDLRAELKRLQRELDSGLTATVSGERMPADSRAGWRGWRMKAVLAFGGLAILTVAWFLLSRIGDRATVELDGGTTSQEYRATAQARSASGVQPSAGTDKLVGVRWNNKKYFFFRGSEYYRYDVEYDRIDADHPKPITGNWKGIWADGVDAVIISPWDNRKAYIFKGKEYIQYDTALDRGPSVDSPQPIAGNWQGIWPDGIDAAIVWNDGKLYFFKGSEYIRFDIKSKRSDPGYPAPIAGSWPGMWSSDIGTIFTNHWPPQLSDKAYFFKGGQYIRYDMVTNQVDDSYPRTISRYWIGLP